MQSIHIYQEALVQPIDLDLDETYPEAPTGFDSVAYAADLAAQETMWLTDTEDEQDVSHINWLCA